jgi:nicotinate-nucleotide pyrophosphorylase (carboxylating)
MQLPAPQDIQQQVAAALREDIGDGDITAALIPAQAQSDAGVICREAGVICGVAWVNEVFRQIDDQVAITWHVADGDTVAADTLLFELQGHSRSLLTGERAALNFLQLLSGTATRCRHYAELVNNTNVKLLDTRKTIPGLRTAQKYAVTCGACYNHRIGLFDAYLIKENHIQACGSIAAAVATARQQQPGKPIEVEVESLEELEQALSTDADRIMLDNFDLSELRQAVARNAGQAELEASGGITSATLPDIAATGVDYISIGALTKDAIALDLSMRLS